jgi:DNA-binding SARP family transcriptional activator
MEFRLLGPLEVVEHDRPVALGGVKQRSLLAVLLLHANQVVSADRLIDELWGDAPPPTAAKSLQVHVSRLRYLVAGWLAGIIVNLLTYSGYYDIALRDFGLLLGALTLGRLASVYDPPLRMRR